MKKQETVEKNFSKVIESWKTSRDTKVSNIEKQIKELQEKKQRLSDKITELEEQKGKLLSDPGPKAPSAEERLKKKEEDKRKTSSSETINAAEML